MDKKPSLVTINPNTGSFYTAIELAQLEDAKREARYAQAYNTLPGGSSVVRTPSVTLGTEDLNDYSKYIRGGFQIGQDNQEIRANLQPWTEQLGNSLQKTGVIATATFLEGTAGLVAGLGYAALGEGGEGAHNRFVDNEFSNAMVDIIDNFEKTLPNYRTQEEMDNPFWVNAISNPTNFWGETILKNMGFAMGAMGAGVVTAGIGAELFGITKLQSTSKILQGLAKAVQEGKTLTAAEQAAMKQMATLTGEQLASLKNVEPLLEMANVAKQIKSRTAINQAVSSFVGSLGESTFEALQGSREFREAKEQEYKQALSTGQITKEEYFNKIENLESEVTNYQNSVFTSNVALLSLSNYVQFKNIFAKGYTPNKSLVTEALGKLGPEGYEILERSKARRFFDYSKALLKDPLMEMTEEQGQFAIQKAAESYYNLRADNEANANLQNFISSVGQGLNEAYGSEEGWENAFAGFVIGGLGIPSITRKPGSKLGFGVGLQGGMYGEYKQIKQADVKFREDVQKANEFVKQGLTKNLYDGLVVDHALEARNNEALIANDRMNSKTINHMKLANMVDTFVEIGKYDDLVTAIKDENNLSAAELREKYKQSVTDLTGKEVKIDFFKGMTDDQVKEYVRKKGDKAIQQAEFIKQTKQDIDNRFDTHPAAARKDLLLKAAAVHNIDERITSLLTDIKLETGKKFTRGINENFTPAMIQYISDFEALATPVDLDQFLRKKKGLENYKRLIDEYLQDYATNPEESIKFAEKARDLYGLVLQRQAMNDAYFKMADKSYAQNAQALADTEAQANLLGKLTKEKRYKAFYDQHTNDDPEFGHESTIFKIDNGEKEKLTVTGIAKSTGAPITLQNARPVTENPKLVDEKGNAAVRTAKNGDKYATYKAVIDGKEVTIEVKNPTETKESIRDTIDLTFRKGDPNNLYDQDGNAYSLAELEQDPTFFAASEVSRGQQRQELYNKIRVETLRKQINNNRALVGNIIEQQKILQKSIDEAEEILKRAKANKTGKTRGVLDGVKATFKIFDLENRLKAFRAKLAELEAQKNTLFEENNKALNGIKEAQTRGFDRAAFNKAIVEDIATLEKQIKDVADAYQQAEANATRLQEVIDALKALVKVIYPRFKALYTEIYGVDPSTVNELMVRWQTDVTPILRKLRAEQINTFMNLQVEQKELDAVLEKVNELKNYIESSKKMIDSLNRERALFENELAKVLAARRAAQSNVKKEPVKKAVSKEIDDSQDALASEFFSPKPSIVDLSTNNEFKTAGRDTRDDGSPNPNKAQQRWSKTVAKLNLSSGKFSLRVVTAKQKPELFIDAEGKPLPEKMRDEALAVILYKDGKPVDSSFQPLGEDAKEGELIYNFIPLPTLTSTVKGAPYQKFFDAEANPEVAAEMMQKLEDLRKTLFERAEAGTNSFIPVTGKSLGLLETTGRRRTGDKDLTTTVWDTLLGTDEAKKGERLSKSRIEVAKATNDEDAQNGWGYITVGTKSVKVKNGLAYFISADDVVVPLLSRKLSNSEVEVAFDLLVAMTTNTEISLSPEEAAAVQKATATPKKSEFKKLGKNKDQAKKKLDKINKENKFFKHRLYWNKSEGQWGYYQRKKLTKEEAEAARKSKTQSTLNIYDYLRTLIYFGKQDKAEDSLVTARPNPQTQIYLTEGKLRFWDFTKNAETKIDFTQESLEANKDLLTAFLANKYHQISNDKLDKKGQHLQVARVVFDENNKPLYVETNKFNSYFSYLISNKDAQGNPRSVDNVPLTTNVSLDSNGDIVVKSTYLRYSISPSNIKDTAEPGKAMTLTPAAAPAPLSGDAALLAEVDKAIANGPYTEEAAKVLYNKLSDKAKAEYGEILEDVLTDDAKSKEFKDKNQTDEFEAYDTFRKIKLAIEAVLPKPSAAPTAGGDTAAGEDAVLQTLLNPDAAVLLDDNVEPGDTDGDEEIIVDEDLEDPDSEVDEDSTPKLGASRTQVTGGKLIDIPKAEAWLSKVLPNIKREIHKKLIDGVAQGRVTADGLLHLSELAEEGTEYHEALHEVMLGILSDKELEEVYSEATKLYGKPSEEQIEALREEYKGLTKDQLTSIYYDERLAEDFRTYALSGGKEYPTSTLGKYFSMIWDAIRAFIGLKPSGAINSMFYNLYNGEYANSEYSEHKVKTRILAKYRNSRITWSEKTKTGVRPADLLSTTQFTKEVTHAVVGNMFKSLFNDNNSVADLSVMTVSTLETYINDGIRRTKEDLARIPETSATKQARKIFNALYESTAGKEKIKKAVRVYIQNDLGIDLGLYKEDSITELEKVDRDSAAWAKDNTTIHPREGTNAFVKLMVASLPAYERNSEGTLVPEKGEMLGLGMLVKPNYVFNHLLSLLHSSTTFNDPGDNNSMIAVLQREAKKVPYLNNLLALLTDETAISKDPLEANNLITNFQQSMYKAALNYKLWLVNEGDVVSTDPNSETAEDRTIEFWRSTLVENINTPESIIVKPKDASLPRVSANKVKEILKTVTKPKNSFEYFMEAFNKLGFTFNVTDPNEYTREEQREFLDNARPFIDQLKKSGKDDQDLDLDYIFNKLSASRLYNLAKIAASKNYEVTDLQHIGPDGKTRYGISEHNMISIIAEIINSMPVGTPISKLLGRLGAFPALQSSYIANSHFIQEVLFSPDDNGTRRRTNVPFKITIIEGARPNEVAAEGKVNTKADKVDRAWMSFNAVLKGTMPILRTSDKSLEYGIDLGGPVFSPGTINQNRENAVDVLLGYLVDELTIGRLEGGRNIANFRTNVGNGLYFFEDIIKDKVSPILPTQSIEEYVRENEVGLKDAIKDYLEEHNKQVIERLLEYKLAYSFDTSANSYMVLKTLDKNVAEAFEKERGTTLKKAEEGTTMTLNEFQDLIHAFTVNSLIGNIEQTKIFFGHPAFYKSAVDLYKRTAGAVGTKKVAIVDSRINNFINSLPQADKDGKIRKDGNFEVVVLQEPVSMSSYLSSIRKAFVDKFGAEKGTMLSNKYAKMDEADGQGLVTLPEYREFRLRVGEWGRTEESLYQRLMRGEKINPNTVLRVFNILKAQYYGFTKVDQLTVPVYLKFSLMPLIPSVYEGTNMEAIAESMMANGQGIAVFPSGIKVGAMLQDNGQYYPMYEDIVEEGKYEGNPIAFDVNTLTLDYRFMGIQVATNTEIKEYTTRGSQPAKIIVSDRYENGVAQPITVYKNGKAEKLTSEQTAALVKDYHVTTNAITEAKAKELLNELGAVETSPGVYKIRNTKNLSFKLKRAARNRNSPDNLVESLSTIEENGEIRFKYLLDGVPNRNKIENLLFSLINNTVITQKYNGGARIQAASTGFERSAREFDFKEGKAILKSNPDLRFYIPGKYKETLPAQVKIAPNKDMLQVINKLGGIQKTNEILKQLWALEMDSEDNVVDGVRYNPEKVKELLGDIPLEVFQFVAFRIPTQGMNTIEYMEIAEFLDPLAGEAVHLPSELVAKSGGDYDIDKLSVYFRYFTKDGLLETEGSKGLHNKLIDIKQAFLQAEENYTDLLMPNEPVTLKKLAGEETPVSKTHSLTWMYNLDTAESYLVGKAAVGIVARHRTHHTLTQQAGVTINKVYKGGKNRGEQVKSVLNFAGSEDNYSLGEILDSNKNNKIGDIISEFLSAFVDVAKDPFIFRLNGNINTADIYMYLIRRGVPITMATKFMTQPIIVEYFKQLAGGRAMVNVMNGTEKSSFDVQKNLDKILTEAFAKLGGDASKLPSKVFTEEDLAKNVKKSLQENLQDITFVRSQIQAFNDFKRYIEQANNLRALMDATSDDTVRHKNFNALDNYAMRMNEVRASEMFDMDSVQRIFDNTLVGGFQKAQMLHNVYRDLFITESPKIKTALDSVREYLKRNNVPEDSANSILDKAKNALIVHIFSTSNPEMVNVQQVLQLGTATQKSLPELIATTLKSPNPAIRKNPFLKNLVPLLQNPRSDVKALKMFNVKLTTFEFNQLVNGFASLNPNSQKQLAALILLQSGLDYSPETWYDKVSVDVMHGLLKNALTQFKDNLVNFDTEEFLHEFVRNNYMSSDLVPFLGVYRKDGSGNVSIDKTGTVKNIPAKFANRLYLKVRADYPEYFDKSKAAIAKAAGLPIGEYMLLAKQEDGSFKLVNKRGDRLMKEYRRGNPKSLLNRNNVTTGEFRESFPQWADPVLPVFPKNESLPSNGETLKVNCKTS